MRMERLVVEHFSARLRSIVSNSDLAEVGYSLRDAYRACGATADRMRDCVECDERDRCRP